MRFCWSDFERRQKSRTDMRCGFIELLKKEVADLEGRRERLLSGVGGPSHFGD